MKRICILRNWHDLDVLRQTPGKRGVWEDFAFTEATGEKNDYTIVLNRPPADVAVQCPPGNIWAIIQEPPNEVFSRLHKGDPIFSRIYTTDAALHGDRFFHSQPALAWHVDRDYDQLVHCKIPEKRGDLSWVTSNKTVFRGHRARMSFLQRIQKEIKFDLFGFGFRSIEDKWDALAPYRYSLAVENFSNPLYWSEKLADCFLAWTMPVYFGCTKILDFFPPESMICIDIQDPDCAEIIRMGIGNQLWQRNLDAIAYARQLVLNRYQLFPFITQEIHALEEEGAPHLSEYPMVWIPQNYHPKRSMKEMAQTFWRKFTPRGFRRRLAEWRRRLEE